MGTELIPETNRAAAQIFLRSNGLLTRKLEQNDIKRRLLGHWVGVLALPFGSPRKNHQLTNIYSHLVTGNVPWFELCLRPYQLPHLIP